MKRILLAWELGAGYGHVAQLRGLAEALQAQGHDCVFALKDLAAGEALALPRLAPVFQAPLLVPPIRPVRVQVSYASLLHNVGFGDPMGLAAALRAWSALMQGLRVDAVIADHAPTALLAAQLLQVPRAGVGASFCIPPVRQPFPSFQPQLHFDPAVLAHNEAEVLQAVNQALSRLQAPPLANLQTLFNDVALNLFGYRELDTYGAEARPAAHFLGLPDFSHGAAPEWPAGSGPRLFAYLRPFPQLELVLRALHQSRAIALVRLASTDLQLAQRYQRPGLHYTTAAVHLRAAAESCDAMLHYAPAGATTEMLLAGKPGLLLPTDVEKRLVTRGALTLGAALAPDRLEDERAFPQLLDRVLEDPKLREGAAAFAHRYRDQDRARILPAYVQAFAARL